MMHQGSVFGFIFGSVMSNLHGDKRYDSDHILSAILIALHYIQGNSLILSRIAVAEIDCNS